MMRSLVTTLYILQTVLLPKTKSAVQPKEHLFQKVLTSDHTNHNFGESSLSPYTRMGLGMFGDFVLVSAGLQMM
jgi:hypothetical protein